MRLQDPDLSWLEVFDWYDSFRFLKVHYTMILVCVADKITCIFCTVACRLL